MLLNSPKAISDMPISAEKLEKVHDPFIPAEKVKTKFDVDYFYDQVAKANPNKIKQRAIKGHHRKLNSF